MEENNSINNLIIDISIFQLIRHKVIILDDKYVEEIDKLSLEQSLGSL
jgi:hypothetical protein